MITAFIAIGSNVAEAQTKIDAGLNLLRQDVTVTAVSPFYKTDAQDNEGAPPYLNGAAQIETDLTPQAIKALLVNIEEAVGRKHDDKQDIALDFDLLLYGDTVTEYEFNGKTYHLPDKDVIAKDYAAIPLAAIAPDVVHPQTGETLREIAARFDPLT